MTPPRQLIRVEWLAARSFHEPEIRSPKWRTFYNLAGAASQVAIILSWPNHMELTGIYRPGGYSDGVEWDRLNVDAFVAEHLDPVARDLLAARILARASHPDPAVAQYASVRVPGITERNDDDDD